MLLPTPMGTLGSSLAGKGKGKGRTRTATGTGSGTATPTGSSLGRESGAGRCQTLVKASVSSIGSDSSNEIEDDDEGTSLDSNDENRQMSNVHNPKRNRTTILPEQQDYLMSKYSEESNPSRKMLEEISSEVKLKKRVVQVWFQNTRARERKGTMKLDSNQLMAPFDKKCSHCSLTFKSRSTWENHLLSKHQELHANKEQLFPGEFDAPQFNDDLPLDLSKSSHSINPADSTDEHEPEPEPEPEPYHEHDRDREQEQQHSIAPWNDDEHSDQSSEQDFKVYAQHPHKNAKHSSNGHLSPTESHQSSNGINGQRRFRTQMSPLQIKLMKGIFLEYRTPTM
jgi:hypothetical protein